MAYIVCTVQHSIWSPFHSLCGASFTVLFLCFDCRYLKNLPNASMCYTINAYMAVSFKSMHKVDICFLIPF